MYIYVALALYNTEYLTVPLHSLETIVDEAGKIAVVDSRGRIVVSEERRRNLEREREREMLKVGGKNSSSSHNNHNHNHHSHNSSSSSNTRHHQRKQSGNGGHGFLAREREVDWRECWNEGTDAVMDVPLAGVCEILYGGARTMEEDQRNRSGD